MRICLTILFTFIFCILVLLPVFFSINKRWSENKKNEKIETESHIEKRSLFLLDERSLQSQPMFWTVIALPLVVGAILWAFIAYQYEWEISTSAYSSLMKNAQFPFLIIALSPILGAFVMYGHRSIQTFTQIQATNKQIETGLKQLDTATKQLNEAKAKNKIDLYFNTRKHINEILGLFKTTGDEAIYQPNSLYNKAFEIKSDFNDSPRADFYDYLNKLIGDIAMNFYSSRDNIIDISNYHDSEKISINDGVEKISSIISEIKKLLNIHESESGKIDIKCIGFIAKNKDSISEHSKSYYDFVYTLMIAGEIHSFLNSIKEIFLILSLDKNIDAKLTNFSSALASCTMESMTISLVDDGDKLAAENPNPPE